MLRLILQKRFGPLFWTQLLGALNDNLLKNGLVILVAFRATREAEAGLLSNLAAGLFILPFFLFSPVAGQMADAYDKARIMRAVKLAEIAIMALAAFGFVAGQTVVLFVALFAMGTHSAFFGPVKFSILPQHLREEELLAGNAWVETGTFLAILVGTLLGGLFVGLKTQTGLHLLALVLVAVAVAGYLAARQVPAAPPQAPGLKLDWNPWRETSRLFRLAAKTPAVFHSVLGISWFWFLGATVLAQLPGFVRHALQADESVVTLLLAVFSVAVGLGSVLCAKLARGEIELGMVPIGAAGLTLFAADLAFITYPAAGAHLMGVGDLLLGAHAQAGWRVVADFALLGFSGSFFIVPLYALIQARAEPSQRSRTIAANNVMNAIFMVASSLITMGLYALGFTTVEVLLYAAVLNAVISLYIFLLIPEFVMRFTVWILASTIYRLRYTGRANLPAKGPAVLICNHVSFIDWFVITAACNRPVRFVMDHRIFATPGLGWVFRLCKAIPIAPARESEAVKAEAFAAISSALRDGDLVCIFPEGRLTSNGEMGAFKPGVKRIVQNDPVPVVPMALTGLWGSFFSRKGGKAMSRLPKPARRIIALHVGAPLPPQTTVEAMETEVARLRLGDAKSLTTEGSAELRGARSGVAREAA